MPTKDEKNRCSDHQKQHKKPNLWKLTMPLNFDEEQQSVALRALLYSALFSCPKPAKALSCKGRIHRHDFADFSLTTRALYL